MENEVREKIDIRGLLEELFGTQDKPRKKDKGNEEEIAVAREFAKVNEELEIREKTIRVGEIETKVLGRKNSFNFNKKPTFSQEKSLKVKNVEVRKGSVLGENIHEKEMLNEDIDIEKE